MKVLKLLVILFLIWGGTGVWANTNDILERIQERYQEIKSFEGEFSQHDVSRDTGQSRKAAGSIAYLRPGKMKWDYYKPNEQLLVTDGTTLWLFDPLLENVTVQALEKVTQGTPLAFLLGVGDLKSDFNHRPVTEKLIDSSDILVVELKPKVSIAALDFIQLGVNPSTFDFTQIVLVDTQGNHRLIEFKGMQYNEALDKGQFTFEITPDMEVINVDEQ